MGRAFSPSAQPSERFFQISLLGLLGSGYFALVGSGYLDTPTILLTGAGLLLRALSVSGVVRLHFPASWANAGTLAYIGFYPLDYLYISQEFIPATVHLICFLAIMRILSAETDRDYFFVKVIAFLELVAATLLSVNMNFFVALTAFVVFGVATFCSSEIRRSSRTSGRIVAAKGRFDRRLASLTAGITAGIVIMTAGLFFILPRTARAALRTLVPKQYHLTGFSNEIKLGQMGEITQSSVPIMHVRLETPNEKLRLRWRGAALSQFDGKRWYNPVEPAERIRVDSGLARLVDETQRRRLVDRISYQVKIHALAADALFFAGTPELVQIRLPLLFRSAGESYRTGLGVADGLAYNAIAYRPESAPDDPTIRSLPLETWTEHLLLPDINRRIIDLARFVGTGATAGERARAIERYLQSSFVYTTELAKEPSDDPLSTFLFERKRGHCEYFASAMAVMLRSIHIPARVVTGFAGGEYNPMTGWHLIRASDAHSWVEAFLPGRGWTTFDPTPPGARRDAGLWAQFMMLVDAADMMWQEWVVDYDLEQQVTLAARMEQRGRFWSAAWRDRASNLRTGIGEVGEWVRQRAQYAAVAVIIVVGLFLLMPQLYAYFKRQMHVRRVKRGHVGASDAAILYGRMLDILRRRGYEKPSWLTASEFARVIPEPRDSALVDQFTRSYLELRYAGKVDAAGRMVELLRELEAAR